jgi:hypothetical protein
LQFLHPIWLFSIAGIALPVIIHLLNIRQGKLLRVGSTSLMVETASKTATRYKISQLLLLLLRCLLIMAVSMLLAGPQWLKKTAGSEQKGWLLVEKKSIKNTYLKFRQPIDSLLKLGYELRSFDKDFQNISLEDRGVVDEEDSAAISYWALIRKLDRLLPPAFPVFVISGNKLKHFSGSRPGTSINLSWYTIDQEEDARDSVVSARQLKTGEFQFLTFHSDKTANFYRRSISENLPASTVKPDTSTKTITIYSEKNTEDARYLDAAIAAIAQFGNYKISLTNTQNVSGIPDQQDWLFWLSEKSGWEKHETKNTFIYSKGNRLNQVSWLSLDNGPVDQDAVQIFRMIDSKNGPGVRTLWQDGFGNPLLSRPSGEPTLYWFHSRLDPSWTDLPWNASFPALIFTLIFSDPPVDAWSRLDNRAIDQEQIQPVNAGTRNGENKKAFGVVNLDGLFWIIVFFLFLTERIISLKTAKTDG